ncbi:hypothetical protein FKM82_013105 [Ascaphus truei]|uniref:chymotrypsin inhibitor-like n=1 Tax=Ascaphus truei TaxID=8439 RepID=UPI003F5978DF
MNSGKAMTRVLVISLLLVTEFGLSLEADCRENTTYNWCASACYAPATCGQPVTRLPMTSMCTSVCVRGCLCKKGYRLNSTRACILKADCDPSTYNATRILPRTNTWWIPGV